VALAPDPALGRQLNLLEILFDHMPVGIAIFDRDLKLRRCNPTWAAFIDRYTPSSASQVVPGAYFFDLAPGTEEVAMPIFERVLAGETVRLDALRLESEGIVSYWDVVFTPLIEDGEVVGVVDVTTDATERVRAYHELEERVEERTRELSTLLEVVRAASGSLELPEVLKRVARGLASAVGVRHCGIYLVDEERGLLVPAEGANPDALGPEVARSFRSRALDPRRDRFVREILETRGPVVSQDAEADPRTDKEVVRLLGLKSILGIPFAVKDRVVAVAMIAAFDAPHAFTEEQVRLAQGIANTVALAIENARLYSRVRETATLEERARLARELHDSVTQSLYSISLFAEAARRLADSGDLGTVREQLGELGEAARQALKEMRLLVYELRPAALEREGLVGALRERLDTVERRAGVEAELLIEGEGAIPPNLEEGLYRIAQEALNNALKHAHAGSVTVRLRLGRDRVELEAGDDGRGLAVVEAGGGMGLANMRERARALKEALEEVNREFQELSRLPGMYARRGFQRKAGMGIEDWLEAAGDLVSALEAGEEGMGRLRAELPWLRENLAKLANYFRRTQKDVENFIRDPEALAAAREALAEREKTVRALLSALGRPGQDRG
ncbi:TPA: GAF domain-containing protein, partial [Candidatus Bipolaricaulota bacterium]|nr:GAF domain-containing protein [Candidatus Bipolaricaulota bacterium]